MADDDVLEPTEVDLDDPVTRTRNRRVALALGAVAVVAAAAFAAFSLASDTNDPEDPVRAMLGAAERGDVLGVMEQLDPGERDALKGPISDLVDELNRLDVLHDADLGHVTGVDLEVDDLELRSTVVRDDIARVTAQGTTKGKLDVSKLPLGGFVRDLVGDDGPGATDSTTGKLDTGDDFITTVKRGDRWYVSIGYSIAELARRDAGASFDDMGPGVAAKGTDTPEDAVRELVHAATELDVRRIIELLPPGELGAVQDYAGLFIDEAEQAKDDMGDYTATVSKLELDSKVDGDHALVYVRDAAAELAAGDMALRYADGCADVTQPRLDPESGEVAPSTTHLCNGSDPTEALQGLGGLSDIDPPKLSFEGKHADLGIAVTRVEGRWYVSPTRTLLGGLVAELRLFQPKDLTELGDWFQRSVEQAFSFDTDATYATYGRFGSPDQACVQERGGQPVCQAPATVPTTVAPAG
jgi:hypothetical protein